MPASASLVTVEYKINILAPGRGERLLARAGSDQVRAHAFDHARRGVR